MDDRKIGRRVTESDRAAGHDRRGMADRLVNREANMLATCRLTIAASNFFLVTLVQFKPHQDLLFHNVKYRIGIVYRM